MKKHHSNRVALVLVPLVLLVGVFVVNVKGHTNKHHDGLKSIVISIDDELVATIAGNNNDIKIDSSQTKPYHCRTILDNLKTLITRTSEYLHYTTKGITQFSQITVLLPTHWANTNCTDSVLGDEEQYAHTDFNRNSADIQITTDHPVYLDKPRTLQYGPCGTPGKFISVPISFLSQLDDLSTRGQLLLREWIKYRYGVFDENGYPQDEKYPMEIFKDNSSPTGPLSSNVCQLQKQRTINATCSNNGEDCDSSVEANNVEPINNAKRELSLMSYSTDHKGLELCNETTHSRTIPTKHNFLCDGKSIWEILKEHNDFSRINSQSNNSTSYSFSGTSSSNLITPRFTFITPKTQKLVFLLDRTRSMTQRNRWSNLRRTLYRILHYIPSGIELGIISYTNSTTVSLPLTITSTHNRDHLHGRIPLRPWKDTEEACLVCAIRAGIQMTKPVENRGPITIVILHSSPTKVSINDAEEIKQIISTHPEIRFVFLTYSEALDDLTSSSTVDQYYRIPDFELNNLEQNEILSDAFLQIMNNNLGNPINKIYQTQESPDINWEAKGFFTMEESLGRSTWITVTSEEIGDVDGLHLISPTGKEFDLPLHSEGLVFLKIPGVAESGSWEYTIKFYQNPNRRPISIDVVTEARKKDTITAELWTLIKETKHINNGNSTRVPLIMIYAKVLQGSLPVLNANVTAIIRAPPNSMRSPNDVIKLKLFDNGNGDSDITWGDGIYSAYFTEIGHVGGTFTITLLVDNNRGQAVVPIHTNLIRGLSSQYLCCGSKVPHISTVPTGVFHRRIQGESFHVKDGIPFGEDAYPPNRITDLKVERIVDLTSEVKLSWTAPGGDFDKGKAARYEIRCYTSRDALMNQNFASQGILVHNSLTPEPDESGKSQTCTVGIPWANEIFYYGIVPIDHSFNRGKVSNLVAVSVKDLLSSTSTIKIIDAWEDDELVNNLTVSRSTASGTNANSQFEQKIFTAGVTWFRGLSEIELYIIIGGASVFLLLLSTLILILVCVKKNGRVKNEVESAGAVGGPPPYQNIYSKGQASLTNQCCWENEIDTKNSTSSSSPRHPHDIQRYDQTSAYIPASALCGAGPNSLDLYPPSSNQHLFPTNGQSSDSESTTSSRRNPLNSSGEYNNLLLTTPSGVEGKHLTTHFPYPSSTNTNEYVIGGSYNPSICSAQDDPLHSNHPDFSNNCRNSYLNGSSNNELLFSNSSCSNNKRKTRHISFV